MVTGLWEASLIKKCFFFFQVFVSFGDPGPGELPYLIPD